MGQEEDGAESVWRRVRNADEVNHHETMCMLCRVRVRGRVVEGPGLLGRIEGRQVQGAGVTQGRGMSRQSKLASRHPAAGPSIVRRARGSQEGQTVVRWVHQS